MKIIVFSDLHGDTHSAEIIAKEIKKFDFAIFCGDFSTFDEGLEQVANTIGKAENLLVVPGNHETDKEVELVCQKYNWKFLHGRIFSCDDFTFCGCGGSSPTPFNTPFELDENDLNTVLQDFKKISDKIILITHCPPYGTSLDRTFSGEHVGSKAIREFIKEKQPLLNICGHIHENVGKEDLIESTRLICVGKKGFPLTL